ncbi:MAG: alanine--tRNA ligase [Desulfurellaceae bacterium]|nr:alanine--tRNA ligase [Desulfurellaceae bacterium]
MTGNEIRDSFLQFFADRGHQVVSSAPLIPANDPTLLFTNAGMVPFKNIFLGIERPVHRRVVDSQKCLRVSGKHNDLEEVGRDTYHHTFFEMLGNWSFGDYYKQEAIRWAWELLTEVWKLPKQKLWATVYTTDDEADEWWRTQTDINPQQILRFAEKDNFWEMGETGPCGPCSEIHIDRGPQACALANTPGHSCAVNAGCARYIELWNLVFIQYNRDADQSLDDLPETHVDTGMGLERIVSVLQDVPGNYDSDLLRDIITFTQGLGDKRYGDTSEQDVSFRVIADHARTAAFAIADGVVPTNEGRGYVLRRIMRRALRHGRLLGFEGPFFSQVARSVVQLLGAAYPELVERRDYLTEVIHNEETRFSDTLDKGLALLEQEIHDLRQRNTTTLPGETAFRLYDTYGFPLDMTEDFLSSEGFSVNRDEYDKALEEQRSRAREGQKISVGSFSGSAGLPSATFGSVFVGDRQAEHESEVRVLLVDGQIRDEVREGEAVDLIAAETPFYGESGGQVGDTGTIRTSRGDLIEVLDTLKPEPSRIVHKGRVVQGAVQTGDAVHLGIDAPRREAIRLNHSATHIMHSALRDILGSHVQQAGSLVTPDRLRFDFTHTSPVKDDVLDEIENLVNHHIRGNAAVTSEEMSFTDAIQKGALAFFGEKYGEIVRVLRMGDFSTELCGGTHVGRTGDVGLFKFRAETGVASGIRRVEAVTGEGALNWVRQREHVLKDMGRILKGSEEDALERLEKLLSRQHELEKQLDQLQGQLAGSQSDALASQVRQTNGVNVIASRVEGVDQKALREMADTLRDKHQPAVVVLGATNGAKVSLLAAVSKDLVQQYHAGKIIKEIAPLVGGGGGGRPDFAQAGGKDPTRLDEALQKVYELIEKGA